MRDEARHPWVRGGICIPKRVLDVVFDEARAAYTRDEESCGFLVGPSERPLDVTEAVAMENRANKLHKLAFAHAMKEIFDVDTNIGTPHPDLNILSLAQTESRFVHASSLAGCSLHDIAIKEGYVFVARSSRLEKRLTRLESQLCQSPRVRKQRASAAYFA